MQTLFVLNDSPYGTERSYNALRLVLALLKRGGTEVRLFLMADAVACGKAGQVTPEGAANIERMLRGCAAKGAEIGACGTCMDARGLSDGDLMAGVRRSSMAELAEWTAAADKVLVW